MTASARGGNISASADRIVLFDLGNVVIDWLPLRLYRKIFATEAEAEARQCLGLLSGRRHRVIGGIALRCPDGRIVSRLVTSRVTMKRLSTAETEAYIATGDWQGKAGGYAIQGPAAALIRHIEGSYSNIVGFSLYDIAAMLRGNGLLR